MIHWFTRNTQYESPDTMTLLEAILVRGRGCVGGKGKRERDERERKEKVEQNLYSKPLQLVSSSHYFSFSLVQVASMI